MIRYDLKGKTALVTGGGSGIGPATATMLAAGTASRGPSSPTRSPRFGGVAQVAAAA